MAVGRIREMAPRCKALTRMGSVEFGLIVVQGDREAGVGVRRQEEINGYSQRTSVGTQRGTLDRLPGALSRAMAAVQGSCYVTLLSIRPSIAVRPAVLAVPLPKRNRVNQWAATIARLLHLNTSMTQRLYSTRSIKEL